VIYRPTGACNTDQNHPTQPDMGGVRMTVLGELRSWHLPGSADDLVSW
jgi:hypothetical protein